MKTQLQLSVIQFLEDSIPQFLKREDTTSGPLDSSVDCSETNVTVIPRITGECITVVEAVCSIVFITLVIQLGKSKPPPLASVAYISSRKLRFSSVRVRYST